MNEPRPNLNISSSDLNRLAAMVRAAGFTYSLREAWGHTIVDLLGKGNISVGSIFIDEFGIDDPLNLLPGGTENIDVIEPTGKACW